ncbi:glutamate synthase-related protein, partial [Escherichia coli]|nr:glutamate synthase-related protein [Escherichia coli]
IRSGADVAKALAMGADAVAIGQGILYALGCNSETYIQDGKHISALEGYDALGTQPGFCHHCHTGKCPVGVTTQDSVLEQRLQPDV